MSVDLGFRVPNRFIEHCERIKKVWGDEYIVVNLPGKYCAKFLVLKPRFQCSFHRHKVKSESFLVVQGQCILQIGDWKERRLGVGDRQDLPAGTWHRFTNNSRCQPCIIFEASSFHDDADVERSVVWHSGKLRD